MSLLTLSAEYAQQGLCNGWASIRPSVRLSHRLTVAGGFAAEHPVGRRYRSIAAGALVAPCCTQRRRSSKCGKSRKKTSQLQISATRDRFETMYIAACRFVVAGATGSMGNTGATGVVGGVGDSGPEGPATTRPQPTVQTTTTESPCFGPRGEGARDHQIPRCRPVAGQCACIREKAGHRTRLPSVGFRS